MISVAIVAARKPCFSSSTEIGSSIRYFSARFSSVSQMASTISSPLFRHLGHIGRDLFLRDVDAKVFILVHFRFHRHQIDNTGKGIFRSDRQLNRHGVRAESVVIMSTTRKKSAPVMSILLM